MGSPFTKSLPAETTRPVAVEVCNELAGRLPLPRVKVVPVEVTVASDELELLEDEPPLLIPIPVAT